MRLTSPPADTTRSTIRPMLVAPCSTKQMMCRIHTPPLPTRSYDIHSGQFSEAGRAMPAQSECEMEIAQQTCSGACITTAQDMWVAPGAHACASGHECRMNDAPRMVAAPTPARARVGRWRACACLPTQVAPIEPGSFDTTIAGPVGWRPARPVYTLSGAPPTVTTPRTVGNGRRI